MPDHLFDGFKVSPGHHEVRTERVPQIVETNLWQSGISNDAGVVGQLVVWIVLLAERHWEGRPKKVKALYAKTK